MLKTCNLVFPLYLNGKMLLILYLSSLKKSQREDERKLGFTKREKKINSVKNPVGLKHFSVVCIVCKLKIYSKYNADPVKSHLVIFSEH